MSNQQTVLSGIRILDLTRLAPGPYCTMLLADLGAEVTVVGGGRSGLPIDAYRRGKRFIQLDLKSEAGLAAFHSLAREADVVIEGFRPGVCDRLGIGYKALSKLNPRLIHCALTGYGQDGPMAQEAGHDINYVGMSGALGAMGPQDGPPTLPLNLMADFAGGGLYAAYAIMAALLERERSGQGQQLDIAMVDGCLSLMAMHYPDWGKPVLPVRGRGLLTGDAPFYRCHRCADGKYVAVGALESAFFANLWQGLGFETPLPDHMDSTTWPDMTQRFAAAFATRTRDQWVAHFRGRNACVTPVLAPDEVFSHEQNRARYPQANENAVPMLPRFSRSPLAEGRIHSDDQTLAVLEAAGLSPEQARAAMPRQGPDGVTGLVWPPVHR